jgi:hypothetical protein
MNTEFIVNFLSTQGLDFGLKALGALATCDDLLRAIDEARRGLARSA